MSLISCLCKSILAGAPLLIMGGDDTPAGSVAGRPARSSWSVSPLGRPTPLLLENGTVDEAIEASAVEPLGLDQILVAHDKAAALRLFDLDAARPAGPNIAIDALPSDLAAGPKWEGMAQDSEGAFYVVGSHSGKTDAERKERAFLLRFRLNPPCAGSESGPVTIDSDSLTRWNVDQGLVAALRADGLDDARIRRRKVEGLAIREVLDSRGRRMARYLAIGLREPDDRVRVLEADLTATPAPGTELSFRPAFSFEAGRTDDGLENFQLTSLERVNTGPRPGYFVITASEDAENAFHGNRLWFVSDASVAASNESSGEPIQPELVWSFEPTLKAEGFALLPGTDPYRFIAVLVYDNDAHKTHTSSRIQRLEIRLEGQASAGVASVDPAR